VRIAESVSHLMDDRFLRKKALLQQVCIVHRSIDGETDIRSCMR